MKFYQYWIIIIVVVLVLVSIYNIAKMIVLISENKGKKLSSEVNKDMRNLLVSIALLSLVSLVYIIIIFKDVG